MSLTSQINNLIANRPKYRISDQYYNNQALAADQAFGRDPGIVAQEANINRESANAAYQAQNYSNSTSSLLSALSDITGNKQSALGQMAKDEANFMYEAKGRYMQTNKDLAEEQDKEWNYNVNEPYQMKLKELVDRRKARQEMFGKVLDTVTGIGTMGLMASPNSILGKWLGVSPGYSTTTPGK